jgi:hypothetical protein
MSIQAAFEFIQQVRRDPTLADAVRNSNQDGTLEPLVELGAERNLEFTVEELQQAFKRDWGMRWMRYWDSETDPQ